MGADAFQSAYVRVALTAPRTTHAPSHARCAPWPYYDLIKPSATSATRAIALTHIRLLPMCKLAPRPAGADTCAPIQSCQSQEPECPLIGSKHEPVPLTSTSRVAKAPRNCHRSAVAEASHTSRVRGCHHLSCWCCRRCCRCPRGLRLCTRRKRRYRRLQGNDALFEAFPVLISLRAKGRCGHSCQKPGE